MAQIGKDYYEDLSSDRFAQMIDDFAAGKVPAPGPQNGRFASEPLSGLTSLHDFAKDKPAHNASVALAAEIGDTIKRIDGTEVPILTPWLHEGAANTAQPPKARPTGTPAAKQKSKKAEAATSKKAAAPKASKAKSTAKPKTEPAVTVAGDADKPATLTAARGGQADDLKMIKGVGPKLEKLLHSMGFYHFDQIAEWSNKEIAWVDQNLEGFKGRVTRDNWVDQSKVLAKGGDTEFSQRAQKEGIYKP
jgi:NADH-quinone oxidoreductase subunit E